MNIKNPDFVYVVGNFMADGSFYRSGNSFRFEFVDGTPYEEELIYSLEHIEKIKKFLEEFLDKELPSIKKIKNKFILKFRDKNLSKLFVEKLNIFPGKKYGIADIPKNYKGSNVEKYFWIGFLDGDGSIARNSRRIAIESVSKRIIKSFSEYLIKNSIFFSKYESKREINNSYVVLIRSISFRDFADKIGFDHPLKSKLLNQKLKNKDFFVSNNIEKKTGLINYLELFDDTIYIENGKEILLKYGYEKYTRSNIQALKIISFLKEKNISKFKILNEILRYRFKKSKGSKFSIKLPYFLDEDILDIANFVRIRSGGISFSKRYIESFNEDFNKTLENVIRIFDIKPKYTSKNEPLFCSGVLKDFFESLINNKAKIIKTQKPKF